jgi:IclR family transcriptional regulator, mhp operon transcriptional activator
MESTRPIRALLRGLDALTVLNMRDGATVSEIAKEIRLPRTTVYRILETLSESGFAFRDTADERYRLTIRVRGLSGGFEDEAWVTQGAKSVIHALCREIVWPVSIATLSGNAMIVRETTDHSTPLAIERYAAGMRAALLTSAAGRAYLAFCPAPEREKLLDALALSRKEDDKLAQGPRADLLRTLSDIKLQGYATVSRMRHLVEEISLSVPVALADGVLAALSIRFAASTVPIKAAVERFLPRLRASAAEISGLYSES